MAVQGGVFETSPQALTRNAVEVQPDPQLQVRGALAGVGAQTGVLWILWLLGPGSGKEQCLVVCLVA